MVGCKNQKGFSIIELLVVVAVIIIGLSGLLGVITFSLKASNVVEQTNQANALAEELMETVRNYRDGTNWNDTNGIGLKAVNNHFYPRQIIGNPPSWELVLGEELKDGFTRYVVFANVNRDANGNIVQTGGTPDNDTRKVTATVSWGGKQIQLITYITNWKQ